MTSFGHALRAMESGAAKITLDQESFRALASDVRVGILKRLDTRRETVTDLSNLLSLSKPTLLEHLEKLQTAGLVKRIDEGRKWIYYELSYKGRKILHPEKVAITLALASAVVLASIGAFLLLILSAPAAPTIDGSRTGLAQDFSAAPMASFGFIALLLSLGALVVAVALHMYGQRRRDRFFQRLGAA